MEAIPKIVEANESLSRVETRPRKRPRLKRNSLVPPGSQPIHLAEEHMILDTVASSPVKSINVTSNGVQLSSSTDDGMQESKQSRQANIAGEEAEQKETENRLISILHDFVRRVDKYVATDKESIELARLHATSSTSLMSDLMQNIRVHAELGVLSRVPEPLLRQLAGVLETRIRMSMGDVQSSRTSANVAEAVLGMHAVNIYLTILSSPDVPRSLFVQEFLNESRDLLRWTCTFLIFPYFDDNYIVPQRANKSETHDVSGSMRSAGYGEDVHELSRSEGFESDENRESCLLQSSRPQTSAKFDSISRKRMEALLGYCCQSFDVLALILSRERRMVDDLVSPVLSLALSSFDVGGIAELNYSAITLVEAITASYASHLLLVIDAIQEHLTRRPTSRRNQRAFSVHGSRFRIRFGTALLVKVMNVIGGYDVSWCPNADPLSIDASLVDKCRNAAMRVSFRIIDGLLAKLFQERDNEFRTAFYAFCEDILLLYATPEWPGAEFIVQALCIRVAVLMKKGTDIPVYARCTSLDLLGSLSARLLHLFGRSALFPDSKLCEVPGLSRSTEVQALFNERRTAILTYLASRAKFDNSSKYARYCHIVLFLLDDADAVEEEQRRQNLSGEHVNEDQNQLRYSDDSINRKRSEAILQAQMSLADATRALGKHELERSEVLSATLFVNRHRSFARQISRMIDMIRGGLLLPEPTLRARAVKSLSAVVDAVPELLSAVPSLLNAVEASCMDVSKSVREASLDLLSRSFSGCDDKAIDGTDITGRVLSDACSEVASRSISIAASDSAKADFGPEFFERVYPIAQQRLLDSAVSVRKRAISILDRVLIDSISRLRRESRISALHGENFGSSQHLDRLVTRICCSLIDRLDDREDTVRRLAEQALLRALFIDVEPVASGSSSKECSQTIRFYASRLIDVYVFTLRSAKVVGAQPKFISSLLSPSEVEKRKTFLTQLVTHVVDLFHGLEEELVDVSVCSKPSKSDAERQEADMDRICWKRLACSSILESLAPICPSVILPHVKSLSVILKGVVEVKRRNIADLLHIQRVLSILEFVVPAAGDGLEHYFVEEVVRDVEAIVCMCPSPSIAGPAIKALCKLAHSADDPVLRDVPRDTAKIFYNFLLESRNELANATPQHNTEHVRNARQALPRLGLLARYGRFESSLNEDIFELIAFLCNAMMRDWSIPEASERIVSDETTTRSGNQFALRLRTVRALMHFLVGQHIFLPRATSILLACLRQDGLQENSNGEKQHPDHETQLIVLSGLQDIMEEEETRNVTESEKLGENVKNSSRNNEIVLAAEEDADAGYLAVCAQALVPELYSASRSVNVTVRRSIAQILGQLARQGLVLPAKLVPSLFGLLVDGDVQCRENARLVVCFLGERYPSMLSSATYGGICNCVSHILKTCYSVQRNYSVQSLLNSAVDEATGYALLSPAICLIKREHRRGILTSLVKNFDPRVKILRSRCNDPSLPNSIDKFSTDLFDQSTSGSTYKIITLSSAQHERMTEKSKVQTLCERGKSLEDVRDVRSFRVNVCLHIAGTAVTISHLLFFAETLATLDYACGSGSGGSLVVFAGTAATDVKLKNAKEDVNELTNVASRIISNSGQAVLEGAKAVCETSYASNADIIVLAHAAIPLCLLLLIKRFLKHVRCKAIDSEREEANNKSSDAMPVFDVFPLPHSIFTLDRDNMLEVDRDAADKILAVFRQLMEDDCIDDDDIIGKTRRKSSYRKKTMPRKDSMK